MIELNVIGGALVGGAFVAKRFPLRIGRAPQCEVRLTDSGVWDEHCRIGLEERSLFVLEGNPQAPVRVNQAIVRRAELRDGDVIGVGSAELRFGLSPVTQRQLRVREVVTWVAFGALTLLQLGLVYGLLP